MQQVQPSDSLQNLAHQVRTNSESVVVGCINWLSQLVHAYIWEKPEHIYMMLLFYYLNLVLELLLFYRSGKLTYKLTRQKFARTNWESIGGLILLFVGSASAQISTAFFWLPQLIMAILLATLILLIGKHLSQLKFIPPAIYQTIDRRITTQINQASDNEKDFTKQPANELPPVLEPGQETN